MQSHSYVSRRQQLTTYFDQTAMRAWQALTSDAPVNRVRQTVRAGRDRMRRQLLDWLPTDLAGCRILDAGCGTGAFAVEAAQRGADVLAIDVAENLIDIARRRTPDIAGPGLIDYRVGDMCDPELGDFDYAVAMDSLIHYRSADIVESIRAIAARTRRSILFTVAPRTPLLATMHWAGRLIPHSSNRAPAIVPVAPADLQARLHEGLEKRWRVAGAERVSSGFYISQAIELRRQ